MDICIEYQKEPSPPEAGQETADRHGDSKWTVKDREKFDKLISHLLKAAEAYQLKASHGEHRRDEAPQKARESLGGSTCPVGHNLEDVNKWVSYLRKATESTSQGGAPEPETGQEADVNHDDFVWTSDDQSELIRLLGLRRTDFNPTNRVKVVELENFTAYSAYLFNHTEMLEMLELENSTAYATRLSFALLSAARHEKEEASKLRKGK
ncbi:hypothetical protein GGR57DRAFT_478304 [Xylariaceae sp. FL1272]|nr:hypothetical protein GGR57DRAFT_478304 [Xylariaceae sp. FL1272]